MDTAAAIEKDDDVNAIRAEVVEILAAAVVRLLIEGRCLSKQAGRVPLVALSAPECTSSQASREALVQESATPAREDEGTPRDEALDGELDHGARIAELHPWLQLQPLIPLRVEVLAEGKEAHVDALEVVAGDLAEHRTRWERDGAADVRETPVGRDEDHSAVLATQDPQHADVHSVLQIVLAQLLGHSSPFPDRASVEFLAPLKRPSDDRDPVQDALVKPARLGQRRPTPWSCGAGCSTSSASSNECAFVAMADVIDYAFQKCHRTSCGSAQGIR